MALANTGIQLLRRGSRVLLVDWDLEAPGLDKYYSQINAISIPGMAIKKPKDSMGLLGLLNDTLISLPRGAKNYEWKNRCMDVFIPEQLDQDLAPAVGKNGQGVLHVLASGINGGDYATRLHSFSWSEFFKNGGGQCLEGLRNQWRKEYDFVLIDSRTGLTDSGGICTVQMPDILVFVFTANQQSLEDGLTFIDGVQESRADFAFERAPLTVVPLLARWEGDKEVDLADSWLERLQELLKPLVDTWLPSTVPTRRLLERLRVPHVARFGFGEPLPVLTHSLSDPDRPGIAYDLLSELLADRFKNAGHIIAPELFLVTLPPDTFRDQIYLSYRHDDAGDAGGRAWDWLRIGFGREHVMKNTSTKGAGKWREKIDLALKKSIAFVAVIDSNWACQDNLDRLNDPNDFVRYEIEKALEIANENELTIVPLYVEGATANGIPVDMLPASLKPLINDWNTFRLTEDNWHEDVMQLLDSISFAANISVRHDLREWLTLMFKAERSLATLTSISNSSPTKQKAKLSFIDSIARQIPLATPPARSALKETLQALDAGRSNLFEELLDLESPEHLLVAYEQQLLVAKARLEYDPTNTQWQRDLDHTYLKIGDLIKSQGDGAGALAAYQAGLAIAKGLAKRDPANTQWQRDLSVSNNKIGDVLVAQGYGPGALAAYQAGLTIREGLAKRNPANTQWQRDLSVSHERIGDVLVSQGDGAGALAAYEAGLSIREGLAKRDPANTQWQRDLSVSHDRIGDVLVAQGDGAEALAAYQAGLTIREGLAKRDPANTQWQRDLVESKIKIGDVLVAQGDGSGALAAYQAGLAIAEGLASRDPVNTQWQRDLSLSHDRIGDVLVARGDGPGALEAYQAGLAIAEGLARRDPANTQWQRDLSVSRDRIGNVLVAQGDGPGALAAYEAGLAIREGLAKRDPANTQWLRDLSVSNNKIGDVLVSQGDGPGALAAYQADLAIAEGLAKRDPTNTECQRDLFVSKAKIGDVLVAQGDGPGALAAYQAGLAIAEGLAKRDPANTQWQVDIAVSCAKLGSLESLLSIQERREYLSRGLALLTELKQASRLYTSQDWTGFFEEALHSLIRGRH